MRPDGTFAALDATPLYEWGKAAGSIYQEELRRRLTERLGVEWGPDRNGCREMAGFDPGWLRTFSKRTVAIEEHLAGAGPEHPDPETRMRADEAASLATRPRKDGSLTPEVLRERWQTEADGIGLPTGHALEAQVCGRVLAELRPRLEWDDVSTPWSTPRRACAPTGPGSGRPTWSSGSPPSAPAASTSTPSRTWPAPSSTPTTPSSSSTAPAGAPPSTPPWTTSSSRAGSSATSTTSPTPRWRASTETLVGAAIAAEAPGLGADQADAVRALCAPGPAIRSLIAPAGFGKTTTVHAAALAAARAGHDVVGLAATHQAAGELRQAGVPAMTIARFALDGAALPPYAVVVLDEISQVATADAEIVARRRGRHPRRPAVVPR